MEKVLAYDLVWPDDVYMLENQKQTLQTFCEHNQMAAFNEKLDELSNKKLLKDNKGNIQNRYDYYLTCEWRKSIEVGEHDMRVPVE
jgi:hypothetical protein